MKGRSPKRDPANPNLPRTIPGTPFIHVPIIITIALLGLFQAVRSKHEPAPSVTESEKKAALLAFNPIQEKFRSEVEEIQERLEVDRAPAKVSDGLCGTEKPPAVTDPDCSAKYPRPFCGGCCCEAEPVRLFNQK